MTNVEDRDRVFAAWLDEGPVTLPDSTRRAVRTALPAVRQRRRRFGAPWGVDMNKLGAVALGGAALVAAIAVAGLALGLPGGGETQPLAGASGTPPPTAVSSSAPSASSSAGVPPSPATPGPLGLAIVDLDGTVRQDLGLPRDAWTADLSADGRDVAFSTRSFEVGFCGACAVPRHVALVEVGEDAGTFVYPDPDGVIAPETMGQPAWSPDGTSIAVQAAARGTDDLDIWVMKLDRSDSVATTGALRRLTDSPGTDQFPAWSPDGRTIYYDNAGSQPLDSSGFSPTQEIWSVPAAGGEPRQLTRNNEPDSQPDAGPDGVVAYWHAGSIWTMSADGSNQARLEIVPADLGFNPRYSPDGSMMAVLRLGSGRRAVMDPSLELGQDLALLEVAVVDLATGRVTGLRQHVPSDLNPPSWLPDGTALMVYRYDEGG